MPRGLFFDVRIQGDCSVGQIVDGLVTSLRDNGFYSIFLSQRRLEGVVGFLEVVGRTTKTAWQGDHITEFVAAVSHKYDNGHCKLSKYKNYARKTEASSFFSVYLFYAVSKNLFSGFLSCFITFWVWPQRGARTCANYGTGG